MDSAIFVNYIYHPLTCLHERSSTNANQYHYKQHVFCRLQDEQNHIMDSAGLGGLADGLMHQLLSKDVLYQPMRDIGERYPAWLAAHRLEKLRSMVQVI